MIAFDKHHKMATEKNMPWRSEVGLHPRSPLIKFYSTGRCQEPDFAVCPYCGEKEEDWEVLGCAAPEGVTDTTCGSCGKDYYIEAAFGYGFSSYPHKCKNGMHDWVFCSQYEHKGDAVRIHKCVLCEEQRYHSSKNTLLPWKDEYDNPDYFDPEGKLKAAPMDYKRTPVLDALAAARYSCNDRAFLMRAVERHEKEWNDD